MLQFHLPQQWPDLYGPVALIIPRDDKEQIEQLMLKILPEYTVGDPALETTKIGPVASYDQWHTVDAYIAKGLEEGATLLAGGRPDAPDHGYYVKPVIFTDVTNDMTIAREEIFGPVLSVIAYDTVDEAWPLPTIRLMASTLPSGDRTRKKPRRWQQPFCRATSTSTTARATSQRLSAALRTVVSAVKAAKMGCWNLQNPRPFLMHKQL